MDVSPVCIKASSFFMPHMLPRSDTCYIESFSSVFVVLIDVLLLSSSKNQVQIYVTIVETWVINLTAI